MRKSSAGAPTWRCPAPVPFRQLFCCAEKDRFCSFHHIHVQWLERRDVRLKFSFHFSNVVDHLCVRSPTRSWQCHVGFHLLLVGTGTGEVKEGAFACPGATSPKQLRQSMYLVASTLSQRSMQISFQRGSSGRCKLSIPSTQLPIQRHESVPCVQVLFGVVA